MNLDRIIEMVTRRTIIIMLMIINNMLVYRGYHNKWWLWIIKNRAWVLNTWFCRVWTVLNHPNLYFIIQVWTICSDNHSSYPPVNSYRPCQIGGWKLIGRVYISQGLYEFPLSIYSILGILNPLQYPLSISLFSGSLAWARRCPAPAWIVRHSLAPVATWPPDHWQRSIGKGWTV